MASRKKGKGRVRRFLQKASPGRLFGPKLTPREKRLVRSVVERERRYGVRPGEFQIDSANAVHKFLASEFGLKGRQRNHVLRLADGYTAARIMIKMGVTHFGREMVLDENVVKRLLENVEEAYSIRGQSWEARHAAAQLDQVQGRGARISVDTALFKEGLRSILGQSYKRFMRERGRLLRACQRQRS
jgi:hypothetical protein